MVATQIFFYFHHLFGEDFPFWLIFFRWVGEKPPTNKQDKQDKQVDQVQSKSNRHQVLKGATVNKLNTKEQKIVYTSQVQMSIWGIWVQEKTHSAYIGMMISSDYFHENAQKCSLPKPISSLKFKHGKGTFPWNWSLKACFFMGPFFRSWSCIVDVSKSRSMV